VFVTLSRGVLLCDPCARQAVAFFDRAAGEPAPAEHGMEVEYLIEDTRHRGDMALFWGPNRSGYTTDLSAAGRYSKKEAEDQARSRDTDRAHRLVDVLAMARADRDLLRARALTAAASALCRSCHRRAEAALALPGYRAPGVAR
jgi:hypothetical protein